mmetsp:Transcript_10007/g.42552  ORF Transcript_10007/g.42552 Transcript_10007/m.42552 type:complete len:371 (+) Transcript_10007:334-1446(+)
MGTNKTPETPGCTMDPPAAREYAVEPVGVLIITPSASTLVIGDPSMFTSRSTRAALAPRSITTSLRQTYRSFSSSPSLSTTCAASRLLGVKKKSPRTTSSTARGMDSSSNAVRNPRLPMAKEITGGTAFGNRFETHRMVPSPPRHTMKSMILSSRGSSSRLQVCPTEVSQCTAGSTQGVTFFFTSMSTTRTSAVVVFLSLGFFTTSALRGGSTQANCECGVPCCLCLMARSRGSRTSHPSSLHSRSWNGDLLGVSPTFDVSRASKLASESTRENSRRGRSRSAASRREEDGSDVSRSGSSRRAAASSVAIAGTSPGTPEPPWSEPFADALGEAPSSRDGDDSFSLDRATPATSTSMRSTLSRFVLSRCVL